jgi:hypothetical protein
VSSHPIAPDPLTEVTHLLDDLAQLLDISAAHADPNRRRTAIDVAGHIRRLRSQLAPANQIPPGRTPGRWYAKLVAALGDAANLPHAALTDQLDQLEAAIDRAFSRNRRRRWPGNRRTTRPADT